MNRLEASEKEVLTSYGGNKTAGHLRRDKFGSSVHKTVTLTNKSTHVEAPKVNKVALTDIHEALIPETPILSYIKTPKENLPKVLDHQLNHIPPTLPSYLQDSPNPLIIIGYINGNLIFADDTILANLSIAALFPNIPVGEGITAVKKNDVQGDKPAYVGGIFNKAPRTYAHI